MKLMTSVLCAHDECDPYPGAVFVNVNRTHASWVLRVMDAIPKISTDLDSGLYDIRFGGAPDILWVEWGDWIDEWTKENGKEFESGWLEVDGALFNTARVNGIAVQGHLTQVSRGWVSWSAYLSYTNIEFRTPGLDRETLERIVAEAR